MGRALGVGGSTRSWPNRPLERRVSRWPAPEAPPPERAQRMGRALDHVLAAVALLAGLLVVGLSLNILRHDQRFLDLGTYYRAGQLIWLRRWSALYEVPSVGLPYIYPPVAALLFAPLARLPYPLLALLWSIVGLASFAVVLRHTCPTVATLPRWQALLTVLGSLPVWWTLMLGQIGLVLFALAGLTWWLLARTPRRPWLAALPLGLTLAIKPIFLALPLYLWLRQQRSAAAWSIIWAAGVSMIGLAALGVGPTLQFVTSVAPSVSHPETGMVTEQSIAVELFRAFGPHVGAAAGWLILVVVTAATAYGCTRPALRAEEAFALVMAAALLAWPHTWDHYFVLLAPVQVLLWRARPRLAAAVYLLAATEYLTYFARIAFPLDAAAAAIAWLWLLRQVLSRRASPADAAAHPPRQWGEGGRLKTVVLPFER